MLKLNQSVIDELGQDESDIDRKSVLSESSILITEEFVSFRDFIRNYSKFITDYTNKLYETEDLSLTYREMKKYHV